MLSFLDNMVGMFKYEIDKNGSFIVITEQDSVSCYEFSITHGLAGCCPYPVDILRICRPDLIFVNSINIYIYLYIY